MLKLNGIFSEGYNEYLRKRDKIRTIVLDAQESLKGSTLYGEKIDITNPEHIIACLYLMYKDYELYHEKR